MINQAIKMSYVVVCSQSGLSVEAPAALDDRRDISCTTWGPTKSDFYVAPWTTVSI